MAMTLSEAAAATGVNRSTIYRAWKSGRMSATRLETGQIEVDPAELFRVFPPVAPQTPPNDALHPHATPGAIALNALRNSALEVEVKCLREMLDAMRSDRDAWRKQAGKVVAALPPPAPAPAAPDPRRPWWGHRGICSKSYAKELGAVSSVTDQAPDGGASDAELLGNGGFAQPFAGEVSDFLRLRGDFGGPAVRTAFFAGLSYARLHPIAQNVALELGEHRQHAGERPPARRRQIEGLAQ